MLLEKCNWTHIKQHVEGEKENTIFQNYRRTIQKKKKITETVVNHRIIAGKCLKRKTFAFPELKKKNVSEKMQTLIEEWTECGENFYLAYIWFVWVTEGHVLGNKIIGYIILKKHV